MQKKQYESGVLIVEATFVFPIMLFVIFTLLYMGNAYYQQAKLNAVVDRAAIIGAAYAADPFLDDIENLGSVPLKNNDIQPYRYLFGVTDAEKRVKAFIDEEFNTRNDGFFGGMSPVAVSCKTKFNNYIIMQSFTVEVTYSIKIPLSFMGTEAPPVLDLSAKATAPITDNAEFINNLNMAIDYSDASGLSAKISEKIGKVKDMLSFGK